MEEEPRYEQLICTIQNRDGAPVSKEIREAALVELMGLFRYLIKKIARKTWRRENGESLADFEHECLTVFFELVVGDYVPRKYGGAAMFGSYISQKLYWKMVYKSQQLVNHYSRNKLTNLADDNHAAGDSAMNSRASGEKPKSIDPYANEIREAILANATGVEEEVIGRMRDDEIAAQLLEIEAIAATELDERERIIWDAYHYSPMFVKDIGEQLVPPIGTSRVNQIVQQARKKILEELGRRRVSASLAN